MAEKEERTGPRTESGKEEGIGVPEVAYEEARVGTTVPRERVRSKSLSRHAKKERPRTRPGFRSRIRNMGSGCFGHNNPRLRTSENEA
jgi:hypothetical protein